ncbi:MULTISPECIES: DUF6457 domain-containing protein [unclassified Microbacterium]|uniref:DUF6457 domain-containing protein n=1 Tax=unclassified Microbacterium TaxID=2609290 RepID=UPI00214C9A46|nr:MULTISPECIES: DUF6457 domain-containing protein [unclassified Microbacterium]MCR2799768.1 DUF6457 domain-containing protein [Microbacterium sp. zg.Y818]MCR2827176.1 DUF6457 domain-containing protein [Microbacterium sp. zg.Y909]WIM21753.1 DUF6457 domain-containing protein [Microbacterium sp. zg-Y818]
MSDRILPTDAANEWAKALCERFDLVADDIPVALLLDLADDTTAAASAQAAPLSAFVAGLVAGRAGGTPADTRGAVEAITAFAEACAHRTAS